ncbi:MAG: endonuclease V [Nitrosopumilaceae archaeon]
MKKSKLENAIKLQNKLAKKVITRNFLPRKINKVCGVDVSYSDNTAFCSAVVLDKNNFDVIKITNFSMKSSSPYIPGLFMLKESEPILKTLKRLKEEFDVLLVDGHGQLHPRLCGLACYVGLMINKPVIGIAKSLLFGVIKDSRVEINGKILGYEIKLQKKKIYVSVGHKISLKTAVKIVTELIREDHWYPEPLRLADLYSKKIRTKIRNLQND